MTTRWDSTPLIRPVAVAQPFISNPSSVHQPRFLKLWNNSLTSPARVMCRRGRKSKSWRNKDILSSIHEAHVLEVLSRHLGPLPSRETQGGPSKEEQTRSFSEDRSRRRERLHIAACALIIGSENETGKNQEPHVCCSETLLHYISALEARGIAPLRGRFEPRGMRRVKCGAHQSTFCSMTLVV